MSRLLLAFAAAVSVALPLTAGAEALSREGIVGILPSTTLSRQAGPGGGSQAAFGGTLAFGFKPSAPLEVGIDISGSTSTLEQANGKDLRLWSVPFLLRLSWTPTPKWDLRPVFHVGAGKALIMVDGASYKEHTPLVAQATAGLQMDLSKTTGLWVDVGYLYARAEDPDLGKLDAGGPLARAGIYFRWEPVPERGFR